MHISPRVVVGIRIQLPVPVTSLGTLHRREKKQHAHSFPVVCYDNQTMVMAKNKVERQEFTAMSVICSKARALCCCAGGVSVPHPLPHLIVLHITSLPACVW